MARTREVVFAVGAHPDDIEFMMGGTLLLLQQAGHQLHVHTMGNGSCGTTTLSREEIIGIREREARSTAHFLKAEFHRSLVDDIDIFYEKTLLAQVGALVREIHPTIMLVPAPDDYMEDHTNTSRLAVTAAFCRGMKNFRTNPARPPIEGDKEWLDASQGLNAYLQTMEEMSLAAGTLSGRFRHAEGWRRHNPLGFSVHDRDPLGEALGEITTIAGTSRVFPGEK